MKRYCLRWDACGLCGCMCNADALAGAEGWKCDRAAGWIGEGGIWDDVADLAVDVVWIAGVQKAICGVDTCNPADRGCNFNLRAPSLYHDQKCICLWRDTPCHCRRENCIDPCLRADFRQGYDLTGWIEDDSVPVDI